MYFTPEFPLYAKEEPVCCQNTCAPQIASKLFLVANPLSSDEFLCINSPRENKAKKQTNKQQTQKYFSVPERKENKDNFGLSSFTKNFQRAQSFEHRNKFRFFYIYKFKIQDHHSRSFRNALSQSNRMEAMLSSLKVTKPGKSLL